MPTSARIKLVIMAGLSSLAFVFGLYKVRHEFPAQWALLLTGQDHPSESPKRRILYGLEAVSDTNNVRPGASLPLAEFVKADGTTTKLIMIEGKFSEAAIEPPSAWQNLGKHILLVNSVDEGQKRSGGISGKIGAGCGLAESSQLPLNLGEAVFHPCSGPYHKEVNADLVANLAVVIWENPNSTKPPCWNNYGSDTSAKYQQCIAEAVSAALRDMFRQLHGRRENIDAIVFPAVGTGVGQLDKESFYQRLFAQLYKELDFSNQTYELPPKIYLLVYSGATSSDWGQTKNAIAGNLAAMISDWNEAEHKNNASDWASLVGVAGGLSLLLILVVVGIPLPVVGKTTVALAEAPIALVIGWFSASLGLMTVFKGIIAALPRAYDPWSQIAISLIVVFVCGPLLRASKAFDTIVKSTDTNKANQPLAIERSLDNKDVLEIENRAAKP